MQATTYTDIIDDKILEWQQKLGKLHGYVSRASVEHKKELDSKITALHAAVEDAKMSLRELDERETAENTMETKEKILNIFISIDKHFLEYQEKTPFML